MKTHLNDLFDQIEPEEGNKLDDKIHIEDVDLDFDHLINVAKNMVHRRYAAPRIIYLRENINIIYTSKQITKFSILLNDKLVQAIGNTRTGELLTYLVNNSKDSTHLIFTNQLNEKIDCLGEDLENKVLHIQGDAGEYVGSKMSESVIFIDGNAGNHVGDCMKSGKITVKGNCKFGVGTSMKDGKIIIEGSVENGLGVYMRGGIIEVHEDIESLCSAIDGGDVYHKDKLVVKNGELLDSSYLPK